MSEDRPTISSSRLSATDVARHSFGNVRRGFDPHEVRSFLDSVSRELQLAEQREQELRAQVADAEDRARHPVLDEATISSALGQQSANVLRAAHAEAARIVTAAEESAATITHQAQRLATDAQVTAEAEAAERIADAELAASAIRQQIERDSAELVDAARIEGDEVLARSREQGRALVERAQLARREVLADLAQRRRELHMQIEQLRAARDELTAIVRGVRGSVDGIVADLVRADDDARAAAAAVARRPPPELDEIDEEIDDGIVDGVRIDRLADLGPDPAEAPSVVDESADATTVGSDAQVDRDSQSEVDRGSDREATAPPDDASVEAANGTGSALARLEVADEGPPSTELAVDLASAEVVGGALPSAEAAGEELASTEAREKQSVKELFARIRAGRVGGTSEGEPSSLDEEPAAPVTGSASSPAATEGPGPADASGNGSKIAATHEPAPGEGPSEDGRDDPLPSDPAISGGASQDEPKGGVAEPPPVGGTDPGDSDSDSDVALVALRSDLLDPVVARLTRRLKRALQDDQNRLLDAIRNGPGQWNDDLLIPEGEQRSQLIEASSRLLREAYVVGSTFARQQLQPTAKPPRPTRLSDQRATAAADAGAVELAETVVSQLRRRLAGGDGEGDGADDIGERVGAAYREWRGERIERLVADMSIAAFSDGVLAATGPGAFVRWLVTNGEDACPDCDDNSLAGLVAPGTDFPTGHAHPPAHPGCRCLVAPTAG